MNTNPILEAFKANLGKRTSDVGPSLFSKWLDGKLLAAEWGSLTFEFEVRPEFCNPAHILHGGVSASMLDEVMGATVFTLAKDAFFASLNLNVEYLRPAKVGEIVTVKSNVIRNGNTVVHVECAITNAEGAIVAKAVSNLVRTKF
jgi:acyl-coenzyme A thioesterase 13